MATIFPLSASVGQIFQGYSYNGTAWEIIGEDWKPNTYSPTPPDYAEAGFIWIDSDENIEEVDLTQYVTASGYFTLSNKVISGSANYFDSIPQSSIIDLEGDLQNIEENLIPSLQSQVDTKLSISSASSTYATSISLDNAKSDIIKRIPHGFLLGGM